jgi:hypothetical protein
VSYGSWPNFEALLENFWGAGQEFWSSGLSMQFQGATNLVYDRCGKPPYYLDDFLAFYPKFFGLPTAVSGCAATAGSTTITVTGLLSGLGRGQFLQGAGVLPSGSVITGLTANGFTVNCPAVADNGNATFQVYEQPPVPTAMIQLYLNLARSSLQWKQWREQWQIAMGWFIAHYCTLWAQSEATEVLSQLLTAIHGEEPVGDVPGTVYTLSAVPPGGALQSLTVNGMFQPPSGPNAAYTLNGLTITFTSPTPDGASIYATWPVQTQQFSAIAPISASAIAAQGLAGGIQTSKSVGDVSVGYQVLESLKDFGQWNLTSYGQQLATAAKVIGPGSMIIWGWLLVGFVLSQMPLVSRILSC